MSSRPVGPGRPRPVAPWVRTRLRTAPGSAAVFGLLVVFTAFLAAAFPRAVDVYETRGLRETVAAVTPPHRALEVSSPEPGLQLDAATREDALRPAALEAVRRKVTAVLAKEPVRGDPGQSAHGVQTGKPLVANDPWLPRHDGQSPRFVLAAQADLAAHATVRRGRLPVARERVTAATKDVEAAVTSATAATLRLSVGTVVRVGAPGPSRLTVRISGIVDPVRPKDGYWSVQDLLRTPGLSSNGDKPPLFYWKAALLLSPEAAPALLGTGGELELYWRVAPDPTGLTAQHLASLSERITSLEDGPGLLRLRAAAGDNASLRADLDGILLAYDAERSAIAPVVTVAAVGIGTVAAVVLALTGALYASRRGTELALLRARGGSLPGIGGRLLAETAVVTLPAAAAGLLLAVALVPGTRVLPAVLAAATVAVLASCALPLRAVTAHRRPRTRGERDDLVRGRPSRRRTVFELSVLVLAVGAVAALRRRGATAPGDYLVSAAPVLVGLIAAMVLVRLYPLPLRLAARPARRLRGSVGFLSLARAGRAPMTGALSLLVLVIALSTAAFGQAVLAGVADTRDRAALLAVRADARISAPGGAELPAGMERAVRAVSGVRSVTAVRIERSVNVNPAEGAPVEATMVAVEPDSYAQLARQLGLGAFPAGVLRPDHSARDTDRSVLPVVASPGVAKLLTRDPRRLSTPAGGITVRVAAVRSRTPASATTEFLIVDRTRLPRSAATTLLVSGDGVDGKTLRAAVRESGTQYSVDVRADVRAKLVASPLQKGAERIYATAVAAGICYAALAVLLSLLHTAAERTRLLALLRTMGLTARQGRRLFRLEALPQSALAAAGGALAGWATIVLLAPGADVLRLALPGSSDSAVVDAAVLRPEVWSLVLPAVGVMVLTSTVAAVQARWAVRKVTSKELRAGDA
ncbi:FtsX-like permease family protein [Streptomyces sp. AK02-01A]|uniref:FtsX-like permease family protein n=1 Tax=Streptomyces sp. AK02-01A TaxID=3028648 RepID=UPI0029ACED97|nr:FtsX-like permease family protein [Streptomyces sp. AK02-01A]MDX3855217.1 ABC transporter permease [Streptomyces sp. AK02-01A]